MKRDGELNATLAQVAAPEQEMWELGQAPLRSSRCAITWRTMTQPATSMNDGAGEKEQGPGAIS